MGGETKTIRNLKIISLDAQNNMVGILGSVPGSSGTLLSIKRTSPKQEVSQPIVESQEGETTNE
jgi:ribosomal protein L3